jgi:excisionase family DNA binding protein
MLAAYQTSSTASVDDSIAEAYTPQQAARVLGLSRRRITQMLKEGTLKGRRKANGRWQIPASAVGALLKKRALTSSWEDLSSRSEGVIKDVAYRLYALEARMERQEDALNRALNRLERVEAELAEHLDGIQEKRSAERSSE